MANRGSRAGSAELSCCLEERKEGRTWLVYSKEEVEKSQKQEATSSLPGGALRFLCATLGPAAAGGNVFTRFKHVPRTSCQPSGYIHFMWLFIDSFELLLNRKNNSFSLAPPTERNIMHLWVTGGLKVSHPLKGQPPTERSPTLEVNRACAAGDDTLVHGLFSHLS